MNRENVQPGGSPETSKKKTGSEMLAQSVSEYIESHYKNKFSLQEMAGELFVNGNYLLRVFKKHTGYTPLAYHNHVRCERAKEMLLRSEKSVSDVGDAVGFVSSAHFSHVFKKEEGCTPSEYRSSRRNDRSAGDPE